MCGIIGILLSDENEFVNQMLFDGLTVLQHRGQDAAGIVTAERRRLHLRKDNGLVKDVFQQHHMLELRGNVGVGHVRYPTAGSSSCAEAQPLYTNYPYGICVAHNGNLTNTLELSKVVDDQIRHVNTDSDSELLLNIFAEALVKANKSGESMREAIFSAIGYVMSTCKGGYAGMYLINGVGLVGFRDPHGIRPMVIGERAAKNGSGKKDYCMASESCLRVTSQDGRKLAKNILRQHPDHDIDVVIPIPDTSRTSALQLAYTLNVTFREGFIKNRYIARTFIMPGQETRKKSVRLKLNTIKSEFAGRNVLLVDDSVVRGTTAHEIVQMAREAGARKVYFSAAPPIRYPNIYGIDIPTRQELVAFGRDEAEIAAKIGCDWIVFQNLDDLEEAISECASPNHPLTSFDTSCFSGKYVTGETIDSEYFERLHSLRNDDVLQGKEAAPGEADGVNGRPPQASSNGCESVSNDKRDGVKERGSCEPISNNQ
ncbi:amidophosphoribosyltransferase [Fragilaria crotonensis]|nr:amidophosphoribosyltransferase [Fragilaria crotonensis]